jgi:hypothetical protein
MKGLARDSWCETVQLRSEAPTCAAHPAPHPHHCPRPNCPAPHLRLHPPTQAVSPHWAIRAFTGKGGFEEGWRLLAGVMLCVTGAEAMYADLGHFNAAAVTVRARGR